MGKGASYTQGAVWEALWGQLAGAELQPVHWGEGQTSRKTRKGLEMHWEGLERLRRRGSRNI